MPQIQLLGGFASPFTRKVRIAFAEKNIPFEHVKASAAGEENPVVPHNPLGKIPVIVVDGKKAIYDSSVIVEYIDTLSSSPMLFPPVGMDRVEVKRWESLGDGICDAGVAFMGEKRRELDAKLSKEVMDRQFNKVRRGIETAARELGDREFCFGKGFTAADIAIGMALGYIAFRLPEYEWGNLFPNLKAYNERLLKRPAFSSTMPKD